MTEEMERFFDRLWPLNRSLTGNGNRETLRILSELVDMQTIEVPSGTRCFDWTVPPEWNVKEAWIKDKNGNKIVDFADNNLHLIGYSHPFRGTLDLAELKPHIHTIPEQPDVIPYITSYYSPSWGFCMTHDQFSMLEDGQYEVMIDVDMNEHGFMTIGEAVLPGKSDKEILISTYICHPSMANNELSGPIVSAFLYDALKSKSDRYYTCRFLFMPETIGAIWYLSEFGKRMLERVIAGYVLTCIGDGGSLTYKRSRRGDSLADLAAEQVLDTANVKFKVEEFFPTGSDERQYCSPGFNLPVGSLMRTRYGKYKEYHTSADNKSLMSFEGMHDSVKILSDIVDTIDNNALYLNLMPYCEPQLGVRGLYPKFGSRKNTAEIVKAMMWVLNQADGTNDLLKIGKRSRVKFDELAEAGKALSNAGILKRIN